VSRIAGKLSATAEAELIVVLVLLTATGADDHLGAPCKGTTVRLGP
jgi:hypothetical protein